MFRFSHGGGGRHHHRLGGHGPGPELDVERFFHWVERLNDGEHRRRGGGSGRSRRMFDGGELRLVLLKLIADAPRHGYDLIREIEAMTGGTYAPSPGVIYPTITLLDEMGFIEEQRSEGARSVSPPPTPAARICPKMLSRSRRCLPGSGRWGASPAGRCRTHPACHGWPEDGGHGTLRQRRCPAGHGASSGGHDR